MLMDLIPPSRDTIWQTGLKKEDPKICCLQETHLIDRNKHWFRRKAGRRFTKTMPPQNRQE
jgi:hypothetical protein